MGRPALTPAQRAISLRTRYETNVIRNPDGCWGWRRPVNPSSGYPRLADGRHGQIGMHRFSYELHVGPIPEDLWVLHRCDNKLCTRPDHLYLGSQVANGHDIRTRKTSLKSHCRRGHPKTPSNTYVRVDQRGYVERHCEPCRRARQRKD